VGFESLDSPRARATPQVSAGVPNCLELPRDLREGRELGIPLCCRLRFAIEWAFFPYHESAVRRGIRFNHDGIEYVPCGVLHRATVTHAEYDEVLARR
jgi:hypothetical protein